MRNVLNTAHVDKEITLKMNDVTLGGGMSVSGLIFSNNLAKYCILWYTFITALSLLYELGCFVNTPLGEQSFFQAREVAVYTLKLKLRYYKE